MLRSDRMSEPEPNPGSCDTCKILVHFDNLARALFVESRFESRTADDGIPFIFGLATT